VAERALPPSDYWRRRASTGLATVPGLAVPGQRTGNLLINLSTVDGFVPAFAERQLR